ncbi:hypothetical protein K3495_g7638 [Podosphaera aphanis]|nr:hypothetical protein K3495_g7638 [Podosphaera aphanis]
MNSPLPLTSFQECASFERTIFPFIVQFNNLPTQLLISWNDPTALKHLYLTTNPSITAFAFSLFLAPLFFGISEVNRNFSQVDRCWSILPSIYNAHFAIYAHLSGLKTRSLDALLAFSICWSVRLTYNYYRKGGYNIGSEDYRWQVLREKLHPILFFILNILFIALGQSILLFLITTPTYVILLASQITNESPKVDIFFVTILIGLVAIEFIADQQQWNFQEAKRRYLKTAKVPRNFRQEDLDRGFVVSGLWSISRHPNFVAEQAIWIVLYIWGCWKSHVLYNWSMLGMISYLILFQGSTWFTELISAGKYPDYANYQEKVGKFLPML